MPVMDVYTSGASELVFQKSSARRRSASTSDGDRSIRPTVSFACDRMPGKHPQRAENALPCHDSELHELMLIGVPGPGSNERTYLWVQE
jgi:hypothetical protein